MPFIRACSISNVSLSKFNLFAYFMQKKISICVGQRFRMDAPCNFHCSISITTHVIYSIARTRTKAHTHKHIYVLSWRSRVNNILGRAENNFFHVKTLFSANHFLSNFAAFVYLENMPCQMSSEYNRCLFFSVSNVVDARLQLHLIPNTTIM